MYYRGKKWSLKGTHLSIKLAPTFDTIRLPINWIWRMSKRKYSKQHKLQLIMTNKKLWYFLILFLSSLINLTELLLPSQTKQNTDRQSFASNDIIKWPATGTQLARKRVQSLKIVLIRIIIINTNEVALKRGSEKASFMLTRIAMNKFVVIIEIKSNRIDHLILSLGLVRKGFIRLIHLFLNTNTQIQSEYKTLKS